MSKAKKIVLFFSTIIILLVSTSISVFATNTLTYEWDMSQIQLTNNSGYAEIVFDDNGILTPTLLYFMSEPNTVSESHTFSIVVANDILRVYCKPNSGDSSFVKLNCYIFGRDSWMHAFTDDGSVGYASISLSTLGSIKYMHLYNCYCSQISDFYGDFVYVYGNDSISNSKLDKIISALQAQSNLGETITSNADKNASETQANDDKNTQAIIDNQNQLAEQEKTETQNSANSSVDDVSGAVPDKSAGMLSALQSLSDAVSYTGTSAKWTFPEMYIPAIAGVTDKINLNPEMEIDFTYWVNQIPQDIRTVISAIATIGLIVFAFKELYSLISYAFTLKGGFNYE